MLKDIHSSFKPAEAYRHHRVEKHEILKQMLPLWEYLI